MRRSGHVPMRPKAGARGAVAALLGSVLLSGLAACGTPPTAGSGPTGTVDVPIQPTLEPLDTRLPTIDPSAVEADGSFDVSEDLTTTSCAPTDGVWSYEGVIRNSSSSERAVTVAITLVQTSDMSVVYTKEVEVTIPAGGSAPVDVKGFRADPAKRLECLTGATIKEG